MSKLSDLPYGIQQSGSGLMMSYIYISYIIIAFKRILYKSEIRQTVYGLLKLDKRESVSPEHLTGPLTVGTVLYDQRSFALIKQ